MEKKIFGYLVAAVVAVFAVSCGEDEPDGGSGGGGGEDITRVKDGNGKVFLESGVLVDANMSFTSGELAQALTYEWEREYFFYYDRAKISSRVERDGLPVAIHPDYTMDSKINALFSVPNTHYYYVSGKMITAVGKQDILSGTFGAVYPTYTFTVVSLDFIDGSGRMVMDLDLTEEEDVVVEGYDSGTLHLRTVWRTVDSETAGE